MADYSKRTCNDCGIKLPAPEMRQETRTPLSVSGKPLPTRQIWLCAKCYRSLGNLKKRRSEHEERLQTLREASKHSERDKPPRRRQLTTEELSAMAQNVGSELLPRHSPINKLPPKVDEGQPTAPALKEGTKLSSLDYMIMGLMIIFFMTIICGLIWFVFSINFTEFMVGAAVFGIFLWLFPIQK